MVRKFKLDDNEYDIDLLNDAGKIHLKALQFVTERVQELENNRALLQRAKKSYVDSLKQEMLSNKAGFLFGDT